MTNLAAEPKTLTMRDHARRDVLAPAAGVKVGLLRRFINLNRRASAWLEKRLPQAQEDLYARFDACIKTFQPLAPKGVIADIGGGRTCSFAHLIDPELRARLVAVDISADELAHNHDVHDKRVADVSKSLPFADGEVGLLVSRTLLEHVSDVGSFTRHSSRVLCDGGYAIHLIPCRYAPFAVVARVVPFALAKWLLHFFRPETTGLVEFPVFYDRCTFGAMRRAMLRAGFRSVEGYFSYYQSDYFDAFLPAYVASALYEMVMRFLGRRDLAAYMLVIGQK